jgi:hypothetical protein
MHCYSSIWTAQLFYRTSSARGLSDGKVEVSHRAWELRPRAADWVVEEAVICELVSATVSLQTGKEQGNSGNLGQSQTQIPRFGT